jgi:hypothetical protein
VVDVEEKVEGEGGCFKVIQLLEVALIEHIFIGGVIGEIV